MAMPEQRSTCAVVGVGASAGGLDALRRLVGALPSDAPFAVVVVQHLDSSTRSQLAEILGSACTLRVVRARSGDTLTAGTVYVVPEGREPFLEEGRLRLHQRSKKCLEPIDALFTSLAAHNEARGCGVLLSGTGTDGVQGLRAIRGAGGMTFAQDPATAEYPGMPTAAIEADVCDLVGSPEHIAGDLMARVRHPAFGGAPISAGKPRSSAKADANAMARILGLVRIESGLDFSGYKPTTVMRRVGRRAMLHDAPDLEAYRRLVEEDRSELASLVDDLLINVTQFFRDGEVFETLRTRVFPEIVATKPAAEPIRVWVVGCSTGEEVYSILITALEAIEDAGVQRKVTVFGTDASEASIRRARAGIYPASICTSVSRERLAKYFSRTENGFEINRDLRDMCVFARQDITRDTPFSRLDVLSMRNVLIYMDQALQTQVLAVAHFALAPGGVLLLGTSETPESAPRLFRTIDKLTHLYRRQDVAPRLPAGVANAAHMSIDALSVAAPALDVEPDLHDPSTAANEMALLVYAPPRVVVDAGGHILHFFGDTSPYLEHAAGRATLDINEMARPAIALDLKEALETAVTTDAASTRVATMVERRTTRHVSIEVMPLPPAPGRSTFLIAFRSIPVGEIVSAGPVGDEDLAQLYESREGRLRVELGAVRARLRAVADEKEEATQSLRSANEEIRSSNEELQSINEELETAKEELQSANEELVTVNDELRSSNRGLALANDDLTNFAASIDVPVLILDRSLRIRRFTPQASRVVRIEETDVGRLLEHLRLRVDVDDLPALAASVIESGGTERREVRDESGRWHLMTLRPYRSADGSSDGVVVAFADVDDLRRNADRLERRAVLGEALTSIDAALSSTMETEEILQCALEEGTKAVHADAGTIEIREGASWVVRYQHGFSPEDVGVRLTEAEAPNAAAAVKLGEPFTITDMQADEAVDVGFVRAHGLKSVLAVPMRIRGSVAGCLMFYMSTTLREFSSEEVDFGRRLGTAVTLALENARLLEVERDAARRAETLNAINEIVRTALTPDELIAKLVGEVSETAGADKCLVIAVHDGGATVTHVRNVRDGLVGVPRDASFFPAFTRAARERHPLLIRDTWADPLTNKDFVVPYETRAFALIPLVVDGDVTHVLALAYSSPQDFDAADQDFAGRLSVAMSVALKNALLYEAEREARQDEAARAERTALLNEIAAIASSSLDVHELAKRVVDGVHELLGAELVQLRLLSKDGTTLESAAVVDSMDGFLARMGAMPVDAAVETAAAFRSKRSRFCDDLAGKKVTPASRRNARKSKVRAYALVPLVSHRRAIGTFFAGWARPRAFTREDKAFFEAVVSLLTEGLANAGSFEAEQGARRRVEALHELTELATSSLEIDEVVGRALAFVHERLGVDVITFWSLEETGSRLTPVSGVGFPSAFFEEFRAGVGLDQPFEVAKAVNTRAPVVRPGGHIREVPKVVRDSYARHGVDLQALLVLPVAGRSGVLGAVTLAWCEPRGLDADDVTFFWSVANELAIAVENAGLHAAEQLELGRTRMLQSVATAAASSLELREICRHAADELGAAADVASIAIYALDESRHVLGAMALHGYPDELVDAVSELAIDDTSNPGRIVAHDLPMITHEDPDVPPEAEVRFARLGVPDARWIVLPMKSAGWLVGAIALVFHGRRSFAQQELTLYAGIADTLATAMANARLVEDLQASQQLTTTILESISDGFYALDREWCFTYANAEAGRMIGAPPEELIGRTMGEVVGDPATQRFQESAFAPAMFEGQVVELERYLPQTDIWADVRVFPSAEGVSVYGRDITERRVSEEALRSARERADFMATLLDDSSQPFGVGNLDGTMGLVNKAFERLVGYSAAELLDISWASKLTPPEYADMETEMLAELVRTGEPVRYEKEYARKDGTRVPVELLVHLLTGGEGRPVAYYAFATDLTERRERQRLDEAFNELRTAISGTLDRSEIVATTLEAAARAVGADAAVAFMRHGDGWAVPCALALAAGGPAQPLTQRDTPSAPITALSRGAVLVADALADRRADAGAARRHRVRSLLAASLGFSGGELGVLEFYRRARRPAFNDLELEFMSRLSRSATLALQNSMLYERERTIADTLQEALLRPPEPIEGLESSYVYRPASKTANVGGDFYDVFALRDGRCGIVIGDVSGKGIEAARLTSLMHDGIHAYALETDDPADILQRLNDLVCLLSPVEQYATVFLGVLDVGTGRLRYCSAGHPPPIVVGDEGVSFLRGTRSPILGAVTAARFTDVDATLPPGQRLVLYTDGVTEARRGQKFLGEDGLLAMLSKMTRTPLARVPQRVLDQVLAFSDGELRDDTVVLSVMRTPPAKARV